jgi:aminotransferase
MDALHAEAAGLFILEDAANAPASLYHGQACGTLGNAGVWSFDAMKILVMIDGGALWLKDAAATDSARMYRYLGLLPEQTSGAQAQQAGAGRWWQFDLGATAGRFISNDVSAAIGRVQLQRLPEFILRRWEVWETYRRELAGVGDLTLPPEPLPDCTSSYYLYWIQTARRDELAIHLGARGIYTTFRYYPLHLVPYYAAGVTLPNAERAADTTLCLPIHQNLTADDVAQVVAAVKEFFA